MYKVALWGAGDGYNQFSQMHGLELVDVVVIADTHMGGIQQNRWNPGGIPQ